MIKQFFTTQWFNPTSGDWTETVQRDLEVFEIPIDFKYLQSRGKEAFKKEVKNKAKQYSLRILNEIKKKHSKMEKLSYSELKTQSYCSIEGIRVEEVQNVFRFRTRMTKVAENYKGKEGGKLCTLCDKHVDNQEN